MAPRPLELKSLIRPNVLALQPYRCARDDYSDGILLDANENALGHSLAADAEAEHLDLDALSLHRYPDPAQLAIKRRVVDLRGVAESAGGAAAGTGTGDGAGDGAGERCSTSTRARVPRDVGAT